ncbi:leucyl aminopeptidase [Mycena maculata]|uniref:Aminopeptidase n=1 Tax=Mycena maculata TaxID=230809 RepID=A0AAD7IU90_9AGAR|nr:leucyl aminopeptidase [Mycena maculata]
MCSEPFGSPPASQDKYRLPLNVKPQHYDLTIWTDLKSLDFGGLVAIDLDIVQEASAIILNCSDDLNLGEASIFCDGLEANKFQSAQITDKDLGRVTVKFPAALPAGTKAQLKINFNAKLRGSMNGYYKSAWQRDGQTEYYALTHFQPIDARAAFPCWDEPLLKATFTITMVSRSETVNISNMPAAWEDVYDPSSSHNTDLSSLLSTLSKDIQWKITRFEETPPMSSYLVAFANGPFEHLETAVVMPLSGRTVPLRIYATPDNIHQVGFCLDVTAKVLPLYETIFNIEYPLPKLDTLAVSAMENWGLITGRNNAFLVDPKKPNIDARKRVGQVQAHEIAHMWFGNITTMEWWDTLYLNEEAIVLSAIFPEWDVNSIFITDHVNGALVLDAKRSSHPIEVECPDANFINQIFDSLSYSKAASVLRMLSNYVGEEKFLEGVSIYLKAHLYGNSITRDLWNGISAATGQDIYKFMDDWVTKIGFPLITVTETATGIHVRQDRFLDNSAPNAEENKTIWNVPLEILTVDKDGQVYIDKTAILDEREKSFPIDTSRSFKLNAETMGLYRVLYTPERLAKIAAEAATADSVFSLKDRMGLIYDVAALTDAGLAPLSSLFTVIDVWRNEPNCKRLYMVWLSVWSSISTVLRAYWENKKITDGLRALIRALFVPLVQRLGYEFPDGEAIDVVELRKTAVGGAVSGRDESVVRELQGRFTEYTKTGDDSRIAGNLQQMIFVTAARFGGRAEFDALIKIIENPVNPSMKPAAIQAVGSTQDVELVRELFAYILTKARDQDVVLFCMGLKSNPVARRLLAKFFQDNYDALSKRFATNSMLKYFIEACFGGLSTQADYDDVETFFKDKDTSRYSMALAQALETIRARIAYIGRTKDDLSAWLAGWEKRSEQ